MRLICPNCEAQYEVPDNAISMEGRDVQCSSCGHTWFQLHPDQEAAIAASREAIGAENGWDMSGPPARPATSRPKPKRMIAVQEPEPEPEEAEEETAEDEHEPMEYTPAPQPATGRGPAPRGRDMDPRVMDVLRAEATREAKVRAAERATIESQPDLGLEDTPRPPKPSRSEPAAEAAPARAAPATISRGEMLPDVDAINSTLRSTSDRKGDGAEIIAAQEKARGGFGRGIVWAIALVLLLALLYLLAPAVTEAVPALEPALTAYKGAIDGAWSWLVTTIGGLMGTLDGMSSEAPKG
ncbi:MAG: zinc-ribbon domain-containing protein [Roseivivax sp.]|nr:zinc-ribbon domain-containing protein [Roseivivax sp.]